MLDKPEDAANANPRGAGVTWDKGWLVPVSDKVEKGIASACRNGSVRMRVRHVEAPAMGGTIKLRSEADKDGNPQQYELRVANGKELRLSYVTIPRGHASANIDNLAVVSLPRPLAEGEEYTLQLTLVGDRIQGRMNDLQIGPVTDTRLRQGAIGIWSGKHPVRDIEYLILDGLSETEALKAAGIEAGSGPQGWKRAEFPTQSITDEIKTKGGTAMDGTLLGVWKDAVFATNSNQSAQNAAVRITAPAAQAAWPVKLVTRLAGRGVWKQYTLHIWPNKAEVARYDTGDRLLKMFLLPKTLTEGGDFTAQFASIGSDHHVWVNGQFLGSVTDDAHSAPGKLGIQANNGRFKSVETLVLDGLSEAEALKVLGIEP